jgi:hypothetical protein
VDKWRDGERLLVEDHREPGAAASASSIRVSAYPTVDCSSIADIAARHAACRTVSVINVRVGQLRARLSAATGSL